MYILERKNTYPDSTSKRLHLKGILAAQDYLNRKHPFAVMLSKLGAWLNQT